MKLPVTNHREYISTNVEVTLDDARATALERIVSLSMDYNRGVGLVQFRNVLVTKAAVQQFEEMLG